MTSMVLSPLVSHAEFTKHGNDKDPLGMTKDQQESLLLEDDVLSIPSLSDEDITNTEEMTTHEPNVESTSQGETTPSSLPLVTAAEQETGVKAATVDATTAATTATTQQPGGLMNLGNTCYMNAAIQALASIRGLEADLRHPTPPSTATLHESWLQLLQNLQEGGTVNPSEFKKAMDDKTPLFVGYRQQDSHEFVTTLVDLLEEEYQTKPQEENQQEESDEMETQEEQESLQENNDDEMDCSEDQDENLQDETAAPLSTLAPLHNCSFSELQVHDIGHLLHGPSTSHSKSPISTRKQELPCKLVGGRIHANNTNNHLELQTATMTDACNVVQDDSSPQEEGVVTNPMEDWFTTLVKTRLVCDSCKYARSHVETYRHLSLEIDQDGGSVQEGLRKFLATTQVEVTCERCFAETATKFLTIAKLPKVLLFHFKRFLVRVSEDWSLVSYRKNSSAVEFEECLPQSTLKEFTQDTIVENYKLGAVIHHIGSSASCGHYTADAVHNGWKRFNDASVTNISREMALDSKQTAYMVLYQVES